MKAAVTFILSLLFFSGVYCQCPESNSLWHRIIFLRDSSTVTPDKQLYELLGYEKIMPQCNYRNDSTVALLFQRIGWLFTKQNNFFNAIQYTKRSISIVNQQKNNPGMKPGLAVKSYWNLYLIYDSLKLQNKARQSIDSCISIAIYFGTGYEYALGAIGVIVPKLFSEGDYFRCIDYATLGENIVNKPEYKLSTAKSAFVYFDWKINALIFLNKAEEAKKFVTDRIRIAEANKQKDLIGALYALYATILRKEGKFHEAINYFKKSFTCNKQINYSQGCSEALNNIGFTYSSSLHQNNKAMPFYLKALNFADANESLNILDNIANIYVQSGNYDSAFYFFQKALDQLHPDFTESDLLKKENTQLPGKITEYITGMILDKAEAWMNKYKTTNEQNALDSAIHIYKLTDIYFDRLKASQSEMRSKLFWKENNRRLYEQAIEACYESKNYEDAFYFFEKSHAVLLNDQINEQRRMSADEIAKQADLQITIIELKKELATASVSSDEHLTIQKKIFIATKELEQLTNSIKEKDPAFYQNYLDTAFITISQLRKNILNNSQTLVEIFSGDSAVYVLTISGNNQILSKINKQLYDSLTTSFNSFITNRYLLNQHFKDFINTAHQLYSLLFKNITSSFGSMIISPDGKGYPFEALVINDDDRNPDYFLKHYATSYTYSAKYLTNQFTVNRSNSNAVLGIAPVQFKNYQNMGDLAGSDRSLKTIDTYFNTTIYTLDKATKNSFLKNFPNYNIVQLYTHASDSSINNDPVIYFSDSALYLSNLIPDRKPVTQLVILSACETANGKLYQGEGIFSFNRGFAALGIPAAISNIWSVDNESTYTITELFYKYLAQSLPTDIALQKAKLEFINNSTSEEKKLPYFWAGCILTGKVDIIKGAEGFPWIKLIVIIILSFAIIYFIRNIFIIKRSKQSNLIFH